MQTEELELIDSDSESELELIDSDSESEKSDLEENEEFEEDDEEDEEEEKHYLTLDSCLSSKYKNNKDVDRMQSKLDEINDQILSPFVFEDDYEMCEVSVEHKEGWKAISILIDSGASDSVAPPGMFPKIKILETNASRAGVEYTAAGGRKIPNLGMQRPYIHLLDGSKYTMTFQVAGGSKALGAVSRIVGAGNRVVFDDPNTVGSFIETKLPGRKHHCVNTMVFTTWTYG